MKRLTLFLLILTASYVIGIKFFSRAIFRGLTKASVKKGATSLAKDVAVNTAVSTALDAAVGSAVGEEKRFVRDLNSLNRHAKDTAKGPSKDFVCF